MKWMLLGLLMALIVIDAKAENPSVEIRKQFTAAELYELPDVLKQNPNSHFMSISNPKGLTLKGIYLKGSAKGRWRIIFSGYGGNFAYFGHYINTLNVKSGDHIIALNPLGQGQEAFLSIEKSCLCIEPQGKIEGWDHLLFQTQLITQAIYQFSGQNKLWLEGQSLGSYILRGYLLGVVFNNEGIPKIDKNASLHIKKRISGVILHQPIKFIDLIFNASQISEYTKLEENLPDFISASKTFTKYLKEYPNVSAKFLYYVSNFLMKISSTIDDKMRGFQHPDNLGKTGMRDSLAYGFSFQLPNYISSYTSAFIKKSEWPLQKLDYNQQLKMRGRYIVPVQYRISKFDALNIPPQSIAEAQLMKSEYIIMKNMGHADMFTEKTGPINAEATNEFSNKVEQKK